MADDEKTEREQTLDGLGVSSEVHSICWNTGNEHLICVCTSNDQSKFG